MEYTQPRYVGLEEVIEAFHRKAKTPYWSLWDKNQPIEQNNEDDIDVGLEKLIYEIQVGIKRNYTRPLTLLLHPKKEQFYDKNKSPKTANIFFVCCESQPMQNVGSMGNNMLPIQQQLNSIQSQISALQNVDENDIEDEIEDEDEDKTLGYINGINRILEHPVIAGIISKLINNNTQQPVASLSGVTTDESELEEIISVLFSKGVKIEHLKKLSEMPESKIQMLLTML